LHPEAVALLQRAEAWFAERGLPPYWQLGAARARTLIARLIADFAPPRPPMAQVEDRTLPARGGPLPIRLMRPPVAGDRDAGGPGDPGDGLPVVVYFHGGGYVLGGLEESAHEAARLATAGPALVVAVGYRKAPEHPFPAAVEDGYDALVWAYEHAHRWGGDSRRLAVAGCSAGGGLAVAVTHLSVVSNGPRVRLAYLLCPWLDLTLSQPSVARYGEGYGLDREELAWYADQVLGRGHEAPPNDPEAAPPDPADPMLSPALHPPPAGFPTTRILIAGADPLRDEARLYARRLTAAGVPVTTVEAPGFPHAVNMLCHLMPAAEPFVAEADRALTAL
jgi:acetyl esterase